MTGTDIHHAAALLSGGDIVGIPTETVYGLAGNALNEAAVLKIFKAKNRPFFDPLIVHTYSVDAATRYVSGLAGPALKLAEAFWPGPLTLLLKRSDMIPDLVTAGSDLLAIRVPNHPLTLELLRSIDLPLAAPSANPFGYISPTMARHVEQQLGGQVPYILDGGPCNIGIESTIVGFENNTLVIYRLGGISAEAIAAVAGEMPELRVSQNSNPQAPGQLDKHYAPAVRLILTDNIDSIYAYHRQEKVGLLLFGKTMITDMSQDTICINLSENADADEAARNLFAAMRQLDAEQPDLIIAQKLPSEGLGRAINDRLYRASVK